MIPLFGFQIVGFRSPAFLSRMEFVKRAYLLLMVHKFGRRPRSGRGLVAKLYVARYRSDARFLPREARIAFMSAALQELIDDQRTFAPEVEAALACICNFLTREIFREEAALLGETQRHGVLPLPV